MLIDSHAHLDAPEFDSDREQVLLRAREQGVNAIVSIAVDLQSSRASLLIAQSYTNVFTAVGFHPNRASELKAGDLDLLGELTANPKVVAIGEIGLDYYRKSTPHERQLQALEQQLDLAREVNLPVIIHCRDAHKDLFDVLTRWAGSLSGTAKDSKLKGVIHCFSGNLALAWRYIELGFVISLPGSLTYPRAGDKVRVARELPLDKLLVETDSPFLAPQLYRGKRNEPSYLPLVVDKIAQLREVSAAAVGQTTAENTINLFNLAVI